jgi:hypothetical protein
LGLEIHAPERLVQFDAPHLPSFVNELRIENLSVSDAVVDLLVTRRDKGFTVDVVKKQGAIDVQTRV